MLDYDDENQLTRVTELGAWKAVFIMKTKTCRRRWLITSLLLWLAAGPLAQAFYNPSTGRWINRDPINELGFNLMIRGQDAFNWDEEKNLSVFTHNDPVNLTDADGRVPVVAIFFYGNAIGNIGIACYSCKKLNECLETAKDYAQRAGEGMDAEQFQDWLRAAKPASECTGLMYDCGARAIQASFWVAGRLLILRYLAK